MDERLLDALSQWIVRPDAAEALNTPDLSRLRLLRRLAERDVLRPIDEYLASGGSRERADSKFDIPANPAAPPATLRELAATLGISASELLFPRKSWPWTLSRETALPVAGRPNYLTTELPRMYA